MGLQFRDSRLVSCAFFRELNGIHSSQKVTQLIALMHLAVAVKFLVIYTFDFHLATSYFKLGNTFFNAG